MPVFSSLSLAGQNTLHYADFINEMYKESDMIKGKVLELESELLRAKQTELYFCRKYLPKVNINRIPLAVT